MILMILWFNLNSRSFTFHLSFLGPYVFPACYWYMYFYFCAFNFLWAIKQGEWVAQFIISWIIEIYTYVFLQICYLVMSWAWFGILGLYGVICFLERSLGMDAQNYFTNSKDKAPIWEDTKYGWWWNLVLKILVVLKNGDNI